MKTTGLSLLALVVAGSAWAATLHTTTAKAQRREGRPTYVLFTKVQPVRALVLRAAATGVVTKFSARPGDRVRRGETLARLGGPTYAAALASAKAALASARKADKLAHDRLHATESRYPVLSTRGTLDQVKRDAAAADAALSRERAKFSALRANGALIAPVAGTLVAVLRADGERVAPGDALARIVPAGSLWLRGAAYGTLASKLHVGMVGTFVPAAGGKSIAVRIASRIPDAVEDGTGIGFVAAGHPPNWFAGEGGLVTLRAPNASEPAVPTRALVLNRGHWWVVEKVQGKFKPVRVTPDGARGGWTWIASGLKAGDTVVTANAYLVFHRAFAKAYANDD